MEYSGDPEATPRLLRVVNPDDPDNRIPYIPRRKSSINNQHEGHQATYSTDLTRPAPIMPVASARNKISEEIFRPSETVSGPGDGYNIQRSRFPIDGYDPVRISTHFHRDPRYPASLLTMTATWRRSLAASPSRWASSSAATFGRTSINEPAINFSHILESCLSFRAVEKSISWLQPIEHKNLQTPASEWFWLFVTCK